MKNGNVLEYIINYRMRGIYKNNKIEYITPVVSFLTGGNWKTGFSGTGRSGGEKRYYDVVSDHELKEGERYWFDLIDGKAHIRDGRSKKKILQ